HAGPAVTTPGATPAADRRGPVALFIARWICDSVPGFTANRAFSAHTQRAAERTVSRIGARVAKAGSRHSGRAGRILASHLLRVRNPGRLHDRCGMGNWQRNDPADGRASSRTRARERLSGG